MKLEKLELSKLKPNVFQPRKKYDDEDRQKLEESLRADSTNVYIEVDENNNIIDGHNTFEVCKKLKKKEVWCLIKDFDGKDETERLMSALRTNSIRKNLSPIEMAESLIKIKKAYKIDNATELGKKIGLNKTWINNLMLLADMDKDVLKIASDGDISESNIIEVINKVSNKKDQKKILKKAAEEGWARKEIRAVSELFNPNSQKKYGFSASEKVKDSVINGDLTIEEAKEISHLDKDKQEITLHSVKQVKQAIKQIPKSVKKGKVFEEQKRTAMDVINKLKSELNSTTTKMYKMSEILDGFKEEKVFDVIPKDYKETISDILNELKVANDGLTKSIKDVEVELKIVEK